MPGKTAGGGGGISAPSGLRMMLLGRLILLPVSLFIMASLAFILVRVLPGDPAQLLAGQYATPQAVHQIRVELGLNRSLGAQYGEFLSRLVRGDLGTSYLTQAPVRTEIFSRLPGDIELIGAALVLALIFGPVLGTIAAYWRGKVPDRVARAIISVQQSLPDFVIGLLLIYLLYYRAGVLPPPTGQISLGITPPGTITGMPVIDSLLHGDWTAFSDSVGHLILPAVSLGLVLTAIFAKISRSSLASALNSAQVEFARGCGLRERTVIRYAVTTARTSFLTYLAIIIGSLLGGAAIIEKVFDWNGVAEWGINSISQLDLPAIQGFIIVVGTATIVIYLLLDVLVLLLDPRLRTT
jgi:ABC-type dipeptide/oligopeptide/nickel transport system permease component